MSEDFRVRLQVLRDTIREVSHRFAVRGLQVSLHVGVIREDGGRGADFSAHVADRRLAGRGDGVRAVAEVFNNAVRAALRRQDLSDAEDDVLRRRPALELTSELDTDQLRHLEFPLGTHQSVHEVSAADTDREHAETAGGRGVGVGDEHHAAREVIVLKEHLMADAGTRGPEVKAVAAGHGAQEVVRFLVVVVSEGDVLTGAGVRGHEVIADHSGREGDLLLAGDHELENGHRAANVVGAGAVRTEFGVRRAALIFLHRFRIVEVGVEDLFREGERAVQLRTDRGELLRIVRVERFDHVEVADLGGRSLVSLLHRLLRGSGSDIRNAHRRHTGGADRGILEQGTAGHLEFILRFHVVLSSAGIRMAVRTPDVGFRFDSGFLGPKKFLRPLQYGEHCSADLPLRSVFSVKRLFGGCPFWVSNLTLMP